jgi:anti-anti-sigma factor
MLIEIEQQDEICVIRCSGRFVTGPGREYLESKLEEIRKLNCRRVLADFTEVPSIDSMGLSFLMSVYDFAVDTSGGFVLIGAGPLVRQALQVTRLIGVIRVAANLTSGLAALRGGTL